MKIVDIIFALICGIIIGFLAGDFLEAGGFHIGFYYILIVWLVFPLVTLVCLWAADQIGRKFLFIFQGAKFSLVGAVATIVDLKVFEFLLVPLDFFIPFGQLAAKSLSFFIATLLKFWGNKYWTFSRPSKDTIKQEITGFLAITLIGIIIDVTAFYSLKNIAGAPAIPGAIETKIIVICADLIAALWNFLGYKFFVFKTKKPLIESL